MYTALDGFETPPDETTTSLGTDFSIHNFAQFTSPVLSTAFAFDVFFASAWRDALAAKITAPVCSVMRLAKLAASVTSPARASGGKRRRRCRADGVKAHSRRTFSNGDELRRVADEFSGARRGDAGPALLLQVPDALEARPAVRSKDQDRLCSGNGVLAASSCGCGSYAGNGSTRESQGTPVVQQASQHQH